MKRWIRKSELDARIGRDTPVPTEVISNEEYAPPPQTRVQREVEERLEETASRLSRQLGMSRRRFLRTSCGMAAAFAAMNEVFGPFFRVRAAELIEPAASQEGDPDYSARVYGVDAEARRNPLPGDYVDRLKRLSADAGFAERSNLQYGWVRR